MRLGGYLAAVLIVAGLSGCEHSSSAENRHVSGTTLRRQQVMPAGSGALQISKGMSYADLRQSALRAGYKPVVDPDCKSNVMGSDFEDLCKSDASGLCKVCDDLPEVSSCSGDGYCGMYFTNGRLQLHVVTYGMIEDRSVSGAASRLNVDGWDFSSSGDGPKRN